MKCPKCNHGSKCAYIEKSTGTKTVGDEKDCFKRTNFKAKCKSCGWEGIA